jgi:hypothetical protein
VFCAAGTTGFFNHKVHGGDKEIKRLETKRRETGDERGLALEGMISILNG